MAKPLGALAVSDIEAHLARYLSKYSTASQPERAPAQWLCKVLHLLRPAPAPDVFKMKSMHSQALYVVASQRSSRTGGMKING